MPVRYACSLFPGPPESPDTFVLSRAAPASDWPTDILCCDRSAVEQPLFLLEEKVRGRSAAQGVEVGELYIDVGGLERCQETCKFR